MSTDVVGFSTARRSSRATSVAGWLAGGTARLYSTPRPASADTAISSQTLMAEFTFPSPAGSVTNGVFTAGAVAAALALASATATWARLADSSGVVIADVDAGAPASGAGLIIDNPAISAGGYVSLMSFTLTEV